MTKNIQDIKDLIQPILSEYGVEKAEVFGSFASGNITDASDVDMLVSMKNPVSLITFFKLNNKLEDVLGRKVDLATPDSINPRLSSRIGNKISVYEG